ITTFGANQVVFITFTVHEHIHCLYKLSDAVSMLDMLLSLANACTKQENTLAIKQGRYPILDLITGQQPMCNNSYISEGSNIVIIAGLNMSGKSTYLKQVVLCQIMAQIGSFVSTSAFLNRFDNFKTNSSTFIVEVKVVHFQCTDFLMHDKSLIIDALGRSTSAEWGVVICHSICKFLVSLRVGTLSNQHICELETLYPNVENQHMEVQHTCTGNTGTESVVYTFLLSHGSSYFLGGAELPDLPSVAILLIRKCD
uniref:DNA mismatch repair proteins mutS family domain-containing protein n=1 Tax=Oncorhynchus kisutch TaxID=8019 RepID=A0A8C7CQI9_ONCKI